jgi:hypothetical protein
MLNFTANNLEFPHRPMAVLKNMFPQGNLNTFALFAFTRFYLRVLADGNGIVQRLKRPRDKFGLVDSVGFELSSKGVQADAKTPGCLGFVLA